MSVLFPKVNKPREWDYRPIYYDREKEARKEKLARLQALRRETEKSEKEGTKEHSHSLHRGSFREAHAARKLRAKAKRQSRLVTWLAVLAILIVLFYILM